MNETLKEHSSKLSLLSGSNNGGVSEHIFQKLVERVDKLETLIKSLQ